MMKSIMYVQANLFEILKAKMLMRAGVEMAVQMRVDDARRRRRPKGDSLVE